jgi:hypothetical protein
MAVGLQDFLENLSEIDFKESRLLIVPNDHISPGFWAALTAFANSNNYTTANIQFGNDGQTTYSNTLGLNYALTRDDSLEPQRPNMGNTYSPIVKLDGAEVTDNATSTINSCLRSFSPQCHDHTGFKELCDVVGELHSNVWDHGESTGYSIAQKSKVPYEEDYFFEFALADCGCGFKSEMSRIGVNVEDDLEAIRWCIKEGNSTKKTDNRDEFAQRVPMDFSGAAPFGSGVDYFHSDGTENHHQGLGLYKLTKLITEYNGELCIASGGSMLTIDTAGEYSSHQIDRNWQGVAIACRFRESQLFTEKESKVPNPRLEAIMASLKKGG